jgi:hypothetical protein
MKSPSASQILAAQRKAKKSKAIDRAYKKPIHRRPTPKITEALRRQQAHGEQYTPEQIDAESRKFWHYYNDLVYCHNIPDSRASFERLIFCVRYICMIWGLYQDKQRSYWLDILDNAVAALDNEITTREQSPNQRRAVLSPLKELSYIIYGAFQLVNRKTAATIYCHQVGVEVRDQVANLYEIPETVYISLLAIIQGASLRACAKRYKIKENELRQAVLAASEYLYRIAESDDKSIGIQRAQSIPDLRSPQWRKWGDPQSIRNAANYARELCRQSEQQTGICVARSLEAREAKIAAQFMKELI